MQVTCELPWLPVLTLFVNVAATKVVMKKTSAMTTSRKSTSRDLLIALIAGSWAKVIVILFCHS